MNIRDNRFQVDPALWSLDFGREVLPELGPECGAVLLELPEFYGKEESDGTSAAFCKLKSNKLQVAQVARQLFSNFVLTPGLAEIKSRDGSYFVVVRDGFNVVLISNKRLAALGGKKHLASTRDYSSPS